MNPANFQTAAVLANIKAIDERYPGSMKPAGIVAMLSSLVALNAPSPFDPNALYPIVKYIDEQLPGSMKWAAMIYLLSQVSASSRMIESGIATLSGGTVTVFSANASSTNPIMLSYYSLNGDKASVNYQNIVAGVSFDINSSNGEDTNQVSWVILQP